MGGMKAMYLSAAARLLQIDADRTIGDLNAYLRGLADDRSTNGVILGLSGGIDSCLLASIAVAALGKHFVHLIYLFDRFSRKEQRDTAVAVCKWLGVELEEESIEPAMREQGVHSTAGMRITSLSGVFNRILHKCYRALFGENPFISSLRIGYAESTCETFPSSSFRELIRQPEEGMNARHRYRRRILEDRSNSNAWLPLGAANRTEWFTGWLVKDGIDDLPIQPMKGLYKTQVRQLAGFLRLPDRVIAQSPSPDMMKGITDEFAIGIAYAKADLVLDYLEGGLLKHEVIEAGVNEREIHLVSDMKRLSWWKRGEGRTAFPVDGGPQSDLRIARAG
jgi:NAD+ synthase